ALFQSGYRELQRDALFESSDYVHRFTSPGSASEIVGSDSAVSKIGKARAHTVCSARRRRYRRRIRRRHTWKVSTWPTACPACEGRSPYLRRLHSESLSERGKAL